MTKALWVIEYKAPCDDEWYVLSGEEEWAFTDLRRACEVAHALLEDENEACNEWEEFEFDEPGSFRVVKYVTTQKD